MNKNLNTVLERIQSSLDENVPVDMIPSTDPRPYNVRDEFFDLMDVVVEKLQLMYGFSEKKAFKFSASVGDKMWSKGELPPFPNDGMSDSHIARWVNAASYSNYIEEVLKYASIEGLV